MKQRRRIRVGVSNPENYDVVQVMRCKTTYKLKVFGQEPIILDEKLEWDLIRELKKAKSPLLIEEYEAYYINIYTPKK